MPKTNKRDPCYEQHVVSIKNMYEESLISIMTHSLYEGFNSLYKNAINFENKLKIAAKNNPNIDNPGVLVIFQTLIKEIPNLNNHKIKIEADRIRSSSRCADIFDDLIKAVVKSNIILLTFNVDQKRSELINSKYHENVIINEFIHTCYVECARNLYGYPELFWHEYEAIDINRNKRECKRIIEKSIREAIRIMLPMKEILLEYLNNNYIPPRKDIGSDEMSENDYRNIKSMLERDLYSHDGGSVLQSTSDEYHEGSQEDEGNIYDGANNQDEEFVNIMDLVEDDRNSVGDSALVDSDDNNSDLDEPKEQTEFGEAKTEDQTENADKTHEFHESHDDEHNQGVKMIPLPDTGNKKASTKFFKDVIDDYKSRNPKKDEESPNNENNEITIVRSTKSDKEDHSNGDQKNMNINMAENAVNNILRA